MKQYKLCTIKEFAEYITDIILAQTENNKTYIYEIPLPDYDFAVADEGREGKSLKEIALNSEGWYGMKKFEVGFESTALCLITDYYGGYCAKIAQIYDGEDKDNIIKDITEMIVGSLYTDMSANKDTEIIVEWNTSEIVLTVDDESEV